jgi:hypothetical protein
MRLCLHFGLGAVLAVAPLACGGATQGAAVTEPGRAARPMKTRQQVMDRDRALIAGVATSLAFGLVGLGTLLAHANFGGERDTVRAHEMPTAIAVSGGLMSLGFLAAIPFGVAVERHRNRHPEVFERQRAPRATASLRPGSLVPALRAPAPLAVRSSLLRMRPQSI